MHVSMHVCTVTVACTVRVACTVSRPVVVLGCTVVCTVGWYSISSDLFCRYSWGWAKRPPNYNFTIYDFKFFLFWCVAYFTWSCHWLCYQTSHRSLGWARHVMWIWPVRHTTIYGLMNIHRYVNYVCRAASHVCASVGFGSDRNKWTSSPVFL